MKNNLLRICVHRVTVAKTCTNENFVWSMYEIVYFQNKLIDTILQVPEDNL